MLTDLEEIKEEKPTLGKNKRKSYDEKHSDHQMPEKQRKTDTEKVRTPASKKMCSHDTRSSLYFNGLKRSPTCTR